MLFWQVQILPITEKTLPKILDVFQMKYSHTL